MNILFFAHLAGSPYHGMVYGHYYLAREWVKSGHAVTIVTASYVHTRFKQPSKSRKITEEIIDGIRYVWLPTPTYKARSHLGRAWNIFSYSIQCYWKKLPVLNADVVICSSHHPLPIYAARKYAIKFNARLVFEVRDLWPLTLIELGNMSKFNILIGIMQHAEDYAYKHADKVVSVLIGSKKYMLSRGLAPEKFVFIPNGISLTEHNTGKPLPESYLNKINALRKEGKFIIGYAGRFGLANALHTLIEAIALSKDQDVVVALLGYGAYAKELKSQTNRLALSNRILFLDPVKKEQVSDFLFHMDAAYIGLQKSPVFRFGISPTKLNDFLLAARPVIAATDAPSVIISESGAVIRCVPDNPLELANAIHAMKVLSPEKRKEMGEKGRAWIIANRDYKVLAARFLDAVK
jgi:glycosyltransferase involved in cell wall biosynthesis